MLTFHSSKTTVLLAATTLLAWSGTRTSAAELQVTVYEGPTDCDADQTVTSGNNLSMHYTGTIDPSSVTGEKGKQFDSSRGRGQTFDFEIGAGRVIKGWDQGTVHDGRRRCVLFILLLLYLIQELFYFRLCCFLLLVLLFEMILGCRNCRSMCRCQSKSHHSTGIRVWWKWCRWWYSVSEKETNTTRSAKEKAV